MLTDHHTVKFLYVILTKLLACQSIIMLVGPINIIHIELLYAPDLFAGGKGYGDVAERYRVKVG
jgi:hypothetical protein